MKVPNTPMEDAFSESILRNRLNELSTIGKVLFALSCAERMLPNYRRFIREHGWGNDTMLRMALDLGWDMVSLKPVDKRIAIKLKEGCSEQAPDAEDFSSLYVSPAIDAANSASIVADLIIRSDIERVVEVASYARDTVDMYVQEIEGMPPGALDLEERICRHPLMQKELKSQREALEAIAAGISSEEAERRWRSRERSNIELS